MRQFGQEWIVTWVVLLLALGVLASVVSETETLSFSDNFNDNSIDDSRWEKWYYEDNSEDTNEQNQQLECLLETEGEIGGLNTISTYDVSNADISVSIVQPVPTHAQGIYLVSAVWRDEWGVRNPESYPELYPKGYYIYKNPVYNSTRIRRNVDGTDWALIKDSEPWKSPSGNLTVRVRNGKIYFYDDGIQICNETFHAAVPTNLYIALHVYCTTGYSGKAIFDDFVYEDFAPSGDANRDGKVDSLDLWRLGQAYGLDSSKPNWDPNCDFNADDRIDNSDLRSLRQNYGKTR